MANNRNGQTEYNRNTHHDPDSVFNSTAKPIWNRVMNDYFSYNNISLSDLTGENSVLLFSTFANCLASSPPVSAHTKKPYVSDTLKM
jgi:hypothetical protein